MMKKLLILALLLVTLPAGCMALRAAPGASPATPLPAGATKAPRATLAPARMPPTDTPQATASAAPPPAKPTPAPPPQARAWGGYEMRMAISARDPRLCEVSVWEQQTGALQLSIAVPDVYLLHYHAAEYHDGHLYIIRRIGYDGYPDEDWTDELWRYDAQGQGTRLYAAQGLDFRVAPGERAIAIAAPKSSKVSNTLVFVDPSGRPTQQFAVEQLSGQAPAALHSASVSPYGWADDGRVFWARVMRGPFEYEFARIDVASWRVTAYDVATLPMGDYALNPNAGLLAYSNVPITLAVDPGQTFWESRRQVTLFVRDLAAQAGRPIAASVAKAFRPSWLDDVTLEYNDPTGEGRVARGIAPAAPGRGLTSLQMADAERGWATGVGSIQRTTDGGAHWQDVTPPSAAGVAVESLNGMPINAAFWGADAAWLAVPQRQGKIILYRTADGGQAWQSATIDTNGAEGRAVTCYPQVLALTFADAQHGWLLASLFGGNAGLQDVVLYRTGDGGATWALVGAGYKPVDREAGPVPASGLPVMGSKFGLRFVDAQHGWLTGNARSDSIWLYASSDGGATWQPQLPPAPECCSPAGGAALTQPPIFFGAEAGVLPVQFHAQDLTIVFYSTRDGGATWAPGAALPPTMGSSLVWSWLDANRGWASDGARLYTTQDGGHTWNQVPADGSFKGATGLDCVSAQSGWAICEGRLLRTTDGGRTWQPVEGDRQ